MWFPEQRGAGRALAVAAVAAATIPQALAAGGGGASPFRLKYYDLDCWDFWAMFAGMVFYGLLIDRVQDFVMSRVKHDRCARMIAERAQAEFMVFGIVGITLFGLSSAIPNMDPMVVTHLTFCDLLVSFAACFLIILAAIYAWMRSQMDNFLEKVDEAQRIAEAALAMIPYGAPSMRLLGWEPMGVKMQALFIERQKLDKSMFDWSLYFQESLTFQICELMNISWLTWLATFVLTLPVVLYKGYYEQENNLQKYLSGYAIVVYILLALMVVTLLKLRSLRSRVYAAVERHVRAEEDESDSDEDDEGDNPTLDVVEEEMAWWNPFLALVLQNEATLMSFFLGMYVMHLRYNIGYAFAEGDDIFWAYDVMFIVAFSLALFAIVPLALLELTSNQAFTTPDSDVLVSIAKLLEEGWWDLDNVRRQLESKAEKEGYDEPQGPSSPAAWAERALIDANFGDDTIMRRELRGVLARLGIHMSIGGAVRMFDLSNAVIRKNDGHRACDAGVDDEPSLLKVSARMALKIKHVLTDVVDNKIPIRALVSVIFTSHHERVPKTKAQGSARP